MKCIFVNVKVERDARHGELRVLIVYAEKCDVDMGFALHEMLAKKRGRKRTRESGNEAPKKKHQPVVNQGATAQSSSSVIVSRPLAFPCNDFVGSCNYDTRTIAHHTVQVRA